MSVRCTQRAPKACLRCAKKRIRCDKQIPCRPCTIRGLDGACEREIVKVTSITTQTKSEALQPSYEDLVAENRRLRHELDLYSQSVQSQHRSGESLTSLPDTLEADIYSSSLVYQGSTVHQEHDIVLPSETSSEFIVEHGYIWTAWIHCGIHIPTFRMEHAAAYQQTGSFLDNEPLWLAIYFAFIAMSVYFMDENELHAAGLPFDRVSRLTRNWYDASILYLYKADFLRIHDMRSVQAVAILLGLFKCVGDFDHQPTILAAGIRIAQCLGMDEEPPRATEDSVGQELSRRIWWTLIICEWLQRPARSACILEDDFRVNLPKVLDDEELDPSALMSHRDVQDSHPRPIQYHIAMIRLARMHHRFRTELACSRGNPIVLENLVLHADESLAALIQHLPAHLTVREEHDMDQEAVWVECQRSHLALNLLFYRLDINRTLQHRWINSESSFIRTKAICLSSAKAIVTLVSRHSDSLARFRPWATASTLFSAAICFAVEAHFSSKDMAEEYMEDIQHCVAFFERTAEQNVLAVRAKEVLQDFTSRLPSLLRSCLQAPEPLQ